MNSTPQTHEPLDAEEERANVISHAVAAFLGVIGAITIFQATRGQTWMTQISCLAFVISATSVFIASALSHHWIHDARLLRRLRAWDQGLIYLMIAGSYTPILWRYGGESYRIPILAVVWAAAALGFISKVVIRHRVNSIGVTSYVILGLLPALWLVARVPAGLLWIMLAGGSLYLIGLTCLINDRRVKYLHVVWHIFVVAAASLHFVGVYTYIAATV